MDHNGVLTGYLVEYGTTTFDNMEAVAGALLTTTFTITGLLPLTTYIFRVAAVNTNGTGTYSSIVDTQTLLSTGIIQG